MMGRRGPTLLVAWATAWGIVQAPALAQSPGYRFRDVPNAAGLCRGIISSCNGRGEGATCFNLTTRRNGDLWVVLYVGNGQPFRRMTTTIGGWSHSYLVQPDSRYGADGEGFAGGAMLPALHPLFAQMRKGGEANGRIRFTIEPQTGAAPRDIALRGFGAALDRLKRNCL